MTPVIAKNKIIILLSNPRNLTTAFERYMMERGDFLIIHEPWAVLYWTKHKGDRVDVNFPIRYELSQNKDYYGVKDYIYHKAISSPVFVKDFSCVTHSQLKDDSTLIKDEDVSFVFLIRDPMKCICSLYKLYKETLAFGSLEELMEIIAYDKLYEIVAEVKKLKGINPIIIDADDLQNDPSYNLRLFCNMIGIPFLEHALTWDSGLKAEWEPVQSWHQSVASSNSFFPCEKRKSFEEEFELMEEKDRIILEHFYKRQLFYYEKLISEKISSCPNKAK